MRQNELESLCRLLFGKAVMMLEHLRPVGRGAAARKYDILTALGALALASTPAHQRRCLRLMTLITARYNWTRNELAVGQREIARLWSCDVRTVKREIAVLKATGWLVVKRQGARGRVSEFRIDVERILSDARPSWDAVGPDFVARLSTGSGQHQDNVVPLPVRGAAPLPDHDDASEWGAAKLLLAEREPGLYAAWLHPVRREGRAGGCLQLSAPSRFHARYVETHFTTWCLAALRDVDPSVESLHLSWHGAE